MNAAEKSILTINGGSSSIKFALFAASRSIPLTLKGQIERIGMPDTAFSVQGADQIEHFARPVTARDHTAGVALLMDWIKEQDFAGNLVAVGHRIVHGGPNYHEPQRLTLELVETLRRLTALDPEHLPESDPSKMNFGGDKSRAWKDIWGCGQGIGAVSKIQSTADFVAQLKREYFSARKRLLEKNYA